MIATNVAPVSIIIYIYQQYLLVLETNLIVFLDFLKSFTVFSTIKNSGVSLSLSVLNL